MNTRFGILAGQALVIFVSVFTAMLALGVIFPLGVRGVDHPINDNGQAVDFQPQMVGDFMVDNTVKRPGDVSGFRFSFTTDVDLVANEDTITVHFDKDFKGHGSSLSRNHVTVSARHSADATIADTATIMQTGAYTPSTDATLDLLSTAHPDRHTPAGLSNSNVLGNVEYIINVPDMNGSEDGAPGIAAGSTVTVTISPAAGITNATEGGNKGPLGVYTSEQQQLVYDAVFVARGLALNDYDANRGKVLTVLGRGFQNGTTVTIYLVNDMPGCDFSAGSPPAGATELVVAEPVASDDTFQATYTVTVPPFAPGFGNCIYAQDGNEPPFTAGPVEFELEGLLTVSPTSAAVGDEVDITLWDWPNGPIPANAVTIAGVTQKIIGGSTSVSNGSANFRIEIGTGTPSGANEIKVSANGESDTKTITISGAILEASPMTAVPNQAITVNGQGFSGDSTINALNDGSEVTLGGDAEALTRSAGGFRNFNNGESVTVDSGGSWSATIIVPITTATTTAGTHPLTVKDSGDREGTVNITIPERTLTIEPAEARPGETVTLTGKGFPATNTRAKEHNTPSVEITYDGDFVGTAIPDGDGNIMLSFRVPLDAAIPSTNRVEANYTIPGAGAPVEASVNHTVPGARVSLSMDEGKPGDRVTVTGDGFKAFASVEYVRIGGIEVTPAPTPATDRHGEFTATILVPDLAEGANSVEVRVGGVTASANFKVLKFKVLKPTRRSFSPATVAPGGTVTVTITAANYGSFGAVTETLPAGFSYVSSAHDSNQVTHPVEGNSQMVRFILQGETSLTYTVTASSVEGSYTFSGTLRDFGRNDHTVGGASMVTVASGDPLVARYDANGNGTIEKSEVIKAINDYLFNSALTKAEVIKLINLYLFG